MLSLNIRGQRHFQQTADVMLTEISSTEYLLIQKVIFSDPKQNHSPHPPVSPGGGGQVTVLGGTY